MEKKKLERLGDKLKYDFVFNFCMESLKYSLYNYSLSLEDKNVDIDNTKKEIEAIKEILEDKQLFEVYVRKMQQMWIGTELYAFITSGVSLKDNFRDIFQKHDEEIKEKLSRMGYVNDSTYFDQFETLDDLRAMLCEKANLEFIPIAEVEQVKNNPESPDNAYYQIKSRAGVYENNGKLIPGVPYIKYTEYKKFLNLEAVPERVNEETIEETQSTIKM